MHFSFKVAEPQDITKLQWKYYARKNILLYTMRSNELLLNKYLLQTYKISLKHACLVLLVESKQSFDQENNMYIYWVDKKYERLAKLITFGTGKVPGSKILQKAFK